MRRCRPPVLAAMTDEELDHRQALLIRLIFSQPYNSEMAINLHVKLCEVRAEQFSRSPCHAE